MNLQTFFYSLGSGWSIDTFPPLDFEQTLVIIFGASEFFDIPDPIRELEIKVRTKFSKTFTTYFFPVGDEIKKIVADWVTYLREEKPWGNDDPMFPATRIAQNSECQFKVAGLEKKHWSTAASIRSIFRDAFEGATLTIQGQLWGHLNSNNLSLGFYDKRLRGLFDSPWGYQLHIQHYPIKSTFVCF